MFCPARYSVIEASTKAGKTISAVVWLFEQAYQGKDGNQFWWVAPVFTQANIAFTRTLRAVPREVVKSVHLGEMKITLLNGASLHFKSGDNPDSLFGEDVYAAIVDEASRLKESAWHAVRSTLTATQGPVRLVGNVRGRRNFFYQLARRAEAGEPNMEYHKIIAADAIAAGVLSQDEVDDARRILPEGVFKELYEAQPSDDGGNPFGGDIVIDRCLIDGFSNEPTRVMGWDLAKHVDFTVGTGLDSDGCVTKFLRFQKPWDETLKTIKIETDGVPAFVDSTGVGDPIVELLQKDLGSNFEGYNFSSPSKQKLMEGLAVAIQSTKVRYPDGVIPLELKQYEYVYTRTGVRYECPEGAHDDAVCSLALANAKLNANDDLRDWEAMAG